MKNIDNCKLIDIPKVLDHRGNLAVIEAKTLPYEFKRVYYLYDIPSGASRGGHSHKEQVEFLVALSGSFDVMLKDGISSKKITLNKPNIGLLIGKNIWRELENFSSGAVCLVLASDIFDEKDYIRDYEEYLLV